ncbi:MAG: hypothetical protein DMD26_03355, partial [Gemmatimonadetes bacterium]
MARIGLLLLLALTLSIAANGCDGSGQDSGGEVALSNDGNARSRAVAADTTLAAAERALQAGHPWQATRLLAPVLRDQARRTPSAVLLAARAAAGWEGWSVVDQLLRGQSWLADQFAGAGYELLARSALERGTDTVAAAAYADSATR